MSNENAAPTRAISLFLVAIALGVVSISQTACQSEEKLAEIVVDDGPIEFVFAEGDSAFPRVRFADGQVSINDRCPVRVVKINRRMPPVYVNEQPVGFC